MRAYAAAPLGSFKVAAPTSPHSNQNSKASQKKDSVQPPKRNDLN